MRTVPGEGPGFGLSSAWGSWPDPRGHLRQGCPQPLGPGTGPARAHLLSTFLGPGGGRQWALQWPRLPSRRLANGGLRDEEDTWEGPSLPPLPVPAAGPLTTRFLGAPVPRLPVQPFLAPEQPPVNSVPAPPWASCHSGVTVGKWSGPAEGHFCPRLLVAVGTHVAYGSGTVLPGNGDDGCGPVSGHSMGSG